MGWRCWRGCGAAPATETPQWAPFGCLNSPPMKFSGVENLKFAAVIFFSFGMQRGSQTLPQIACVLMIPCIWKQVVKTVFCSAFHNGSCFSFSSPVPCLVALPPF